MKCILLKEGYASWYEELQNKYGLKDHVCYRLLQNIFDKDPKKNGDNIIYLENINDVQVALSAHEVYALCYERIEEWIEKINERAGRSRRAAIQDMLSAAKASISRYSSS